VQKPLRGPLQGSILTPEQLREEFHSQVSGQRIAKLPGSLDNNEFTNGYEVLMEHPIIAGFLLERNEEGRVVGYDLRKNRKPRLATGRAKTNGP
jgi:hypothetical protein